MKSTTTQPDATPAGARLETPWGMTKQVLRVVWFGTLAVLALVVGTVAAVVFRVWQPLAVGLIMAGPFAFVAWLLWQYVKRTERMIYPLDNRPTITDGPTVVFVRDRVKTNGGHIEKDAEPIDIGLPPQEAARALRWMKESGKTSRREVTAGAGISQSAWAKLNRALQDFGILDSGRLTDEVDYLLAQLDDI
jgi:hypothetical protein